MNKKKSKLNQFFNESLIDIFFKTPNVTIKIKIQTVLYIIIEVALVIAVLKYV